jgi:hypothetical protein
MSCSIPQIAVSVLNQTPVSDVSPSQISDLISYFEDEKLRVISCGDYVAAQHIEDKINELKQFQMKSTFNRIHRDRCAEIQNRLTEAQQELDQRLRNRDQLFKTFKEQKCQSLQDFNTFADEELQDFNAEYETAPPCVFTKYSQEYLNLRMREKYMISSKRYIEAETLKTEADRRLIIERENQENAWRMQVNKKRELLIARQNDQRKALQRKWDRRWNDLCPSIDEEVSKFQNLVRNLKLKLSEVEGDENVDFDGTATRSRSPNPKTTRKTISVSQAKPPQRSDVSPHQLNRLRSRMAYVRAKAYSQTHRTRIQSRASSPLCKPSSRRPPVSKSPHQNSSKSE